MAIDFGRAARGIATGYLTAKVADTAAQDDLNRQYILQATDQYFSVDKPAFVADEKKRENKTPLFKVPFLGKNALENIRDETFQFFVFPR